MTTDDVYYERGINLRHGYLTEYYVDDPEYIVKIPPELREVAVLLEPTTVVEKGIAQAYEIQRRLRVWRPRRAAVMGAGTIGLLAALALRLRGLEVTVFGRTAKPYLNSDLIEALGARYESTADLPILEGAARYGPFDLIFEATGASPVVFESMQALGKNGVLVLSSVTGGDKHDRGSRRPDQSRVRPGQQGDGGDGEREPGILRAGRQRHGACRGAVSRVAGAPADPPGAGAGELETVARYLDRSERSDQGVLYRRRDVRDL